jgi:hypothetical protein
MTDEEIEIEDEDGGEDLGIDPSRFVWQPGDVDVTPPGPETSTRTEGPTMAGGAYAIAFWRGAKGDPCPQSEAVAAEIVEYDEDGNAIARTYADLKPSQPFYAKDDDEA